MLRGISLLLVFLVMVGCKKPISESTYTEQPSFPKEEIDVYLNSLDKDITLVLQYEGIDSAYVFNKNRANRQYPVASTFKIPNTLIALEEKIISPTDTLHWDGKKRFLENWNQDQTLASAFKYSTVWVYRELARKLDTVTYKNYLQKMSYGNEKVGENVDIFWLDNTLRISAKEQISFLKKLNNKELSFSEDTYSKAFPIFTEYENDSLRLIAKTGLGVSKKVENDNVAWYVGYVNKKNAPTLYFALNLKYTESSDKALRKNAVFSILQKLGYSTN